MKNLHMKGHLFLHAKYQHLYERKPNDLHILGSCVLANQIWFHYQAGKGFKPLYLWNVYPNCFLMH